jgi:hypothetical protein
VGEVIFPDMVFLCVDVEDEVHLIDLLRWKISRLSTADQQKQLFFGTVLPHIESLEWLIQDRLLQSKLLPIT